MKSFNLKKKVGVTTKYITIDMFYLSNMRHLVPKIKKNRSTFEYVLTNLPVVSTTL